jgi:hypothetical protein
MSTTPIISSSYPTQNDVLLTSLMDFYTKSTTTDTTKPNDNLQKMMSIINGESRISLRIIDWFITNYSKFYYTIYELPNERRFKVHDQYKLKLKSFNKKRFDIFCRHERIPILYDKENSLYLETTIAQLNCFKWVIENKILDYIEENYDAILQDMNNRNSTSASLKRREESGDNNKTRKKRQELSISAVKSLKKEYVNIDVKFT